MGDFSDKLDIPKTPQLAHQTPVLIRHETQSIQSSCTTRSSSSSRATSGSSTQHPHSDLPDLTNLVHHARNSHREVSNLVPEHHRLAPVQMGVDCLQMLGSPFSGPPIVQARGRYMMTPERVDSQRRMANQEIRALQTWAHLGLSPGRPPTLRQARAMHTQLDSRQTLVYRHTQSAPDHLSQFVLLQRAKMPSGLPLRRQYVRVSPGLPLRPFSFAHSLRCPASLGSIWSLQNGTSPIRPMNSLPDFPSASSFSSSTSSSPIRAFKFLPGSTLASSSYSSLSASSSSDSCPSALSQADDSEYYQV